MHLLVFSLSLQSTFPLHGMHARQMQWCKPSAHAVGWKEHKTSASSTVLHICFMRSLRRGVRRLISTVRGEGKCFGYLIDHSDPSQTSRCTADRRCSPIKVATRYRSARPQYQHMDVAHLDQCRPLDLLAITRNSSRLLQSNGGEITERAPFIDGRLTVLHSSRHTRTWECH